MAGALIFRILDKIVDRWRDEGRESRHMTAGVLTHLPHLNLKSGGSEINDSIIIRTRE